MSLNDPLTVIVRVPRGDRLGDAMSRIRIWLDSQKIQTVAFTTATDADSYRFTISFQSNGDADHFRDRFIGAP